MSDQAAVRVLAVLLKTLLIISYAGRTCSLIGNAVPGSCIMPSVNRMYSVWLILWISDNLNGMQTVSNSACQCVFQLSIDLRKRIWYNVNVMHKTAFLVLTIVALFNCTSVGRAVVSITDQCWVFSKRFVLDLIRLCSSSSRFCWLFLMQFVVEFSSVFRHSVKKY